MTQSFPTFWDLSSQQLVYYVLVKILYSPGHLTYWYVNQITVSYDKITHIATIFCIKCSKYELSWINVYLEVTSLFVLLITAAVILQELKKVFSLYFRLAHIFTYPIGNGLCTWSGVQPLQTRVGIMHGQHSVNKLWHVYTIIQHDLWHSTLHMPQWHFIIAN